MRDSIGGMWIKLTVCGVTRLGYGHPDGKSGGNAVKELIGDALRNAAMRFGAALDLWHKGDLHGDDAPAVESPKPPPEPASPPRDPVKIADGLIAVIVACNDAEQLAAWPKEGGKAAEAWDWLTDNAKDQGQRVRDAYSKRITALTATPNADLGGDDIPEHLQ
ncbi:MAG: hypothetical protein U5N55_05030 [Cypionkella sp.]|nr:hypothetical protein [Cypionkella sp.]